MSNPVIIKSNPHGIAVILDKNLPFDELINKVVEKFKDSEKFFKNASLAIAFEGRQLSEEEQAALLNAISDNSEINIVCIIDNDENKEAFFKEQIMENTKEYAEQNGVFYRGTLRSGQVIESEKSIIVIGDVNPGAKIISKGNIIIIGALKGNAYAGASENQDACIIALEMNPVQIKIGDVIARSSDERTLFSPKKRKKKIVNEPMIAHAIDDAICIEPISKKNSVLC